MARTRQSKGDQKVTPKRRKGKRKRITAVSKRKKTAGVKAKNKVPRKKAKAAPREDEKNVRVEVVRPEAFLKWKIASRCNKDNDSIQGANPYPYEDDRRISETEYETKFVWNVIDSYFAENRGLQSQAITSFNRFVKETLPNIVNTCGKVVVEHCHDSFNKTKHYVEFTNVYLEKEIILNSSDGRMYPLFPHEARSRHLNYSSTLSVDIRHTIKSVDATGYEAELRSQLHEQIVIADIPIMVKSEFCRLHGLSEQQLALYYEDPMDPGGYFIIHGKEKVIVTQERPANNQLFLFKPMCDSKYQYECEMRSTVDSSTEKVSALWIHIPGNPKSNKTFTERKNKLFAKKTGKSMRSENLRRNVSKQFMKSRPGLIVTVATVRGPIPLLVLFKALGFENDREICETFLASPQDVDFYDALRATMENSEAGEIKNKEDALYCIGYRSIKEPGQREAVIAHGEKIICEEVLPALGSEAFCDTIKGYHIGYMVNRLVYAYLGRIPCDDRDHLKNKRFDLAGSMLAGLLKAQIKNLMNEAKLSILRRLDRGLTYDIVRNVIRQKLMTRGIIYAMSSGNWGDKRRGSPCRMGVAQLLNRLTGMATVSYLRRINSPVNRLVRMTAPRQVHTTGFGYVCPADTPEGETVGLLKSLSVMAEVSTDYKRGPIVDCLESVNYDSIEDFPDKLAKNTKILIDSEIMGTCPTERVPVVLGALKMCRRAYDDKKEIERMLQQYEDPTCVSEYHGFSNEVSITYDSEYREIRIRTDAGRAFRPLLVVKNNELLFERRHLKRLMDPKDSYGWKNLIQDGIVELLDATESETALIAMFPHDLKAKARMKHITRGCSEPMSYKVTYTHCEIHPSLILGVCASLIPYPDHNQSPRNTYQAGMAKQAIGVYQTNFYYRSDTEAHVLHYPQRPLVTTKTSKFIRYDENPSGINTITAICCYSGYNQEDSVILCTSSVQRGLFRSTLYRTKTDEAKRSGGRGDMDERFELPRRGEVTRFRNPNYTNLDYDALPEPGIEIKDDEPLIGKTQQINAEVRSQMMTGGRTAPTKLDVSLMFRSSVASGVSYVDSVMLVDNPDGYRMVKVKTRTPRIPQIGDKFASRHGQKGVVGMDFHETDMPFTKDGIVPDLILNPHAIPSRMTIGHLLETVAAKQTALTGTIHDATCFTHKSSVNEMGKQLEKLHFHKYAQEVMYNGATGRKISSQIFIGPVFYQRLKHMTEDKIHVRSRGQVTELCRQPSAGLQRDGGLRFGEMERDSTISHGAASFLRERLLILSDYHALPVCKGCGNFLTAKSSKDESAQKTIGHLKCRACNWTSAGAVTVEIPYACKLFFQELMSMNIRVKICPENDLKEIIEKTDDNPSSCSGENLLSSIIHDMDEEEGIS